MSQNKFFKQKLISLLVAASATLPMTATAETYDFKACVDTALSQNPEMEASAARINMAESALNKAESSRLPQITFSVTGSRSDNALNVFGMKLQQRQATFNDFGLGDFTGDGTVEPDSLNNPDAHTDINTRIEVLLPVWNGGKIGSYENQAAAMIDAAKNGDTAVQQYLTFNIYQAYEAVHAARAFIEVAKQAKETADSYVKTTQNLVDQGVVVRSEFLSAKVNQSTASVALAKAQSEERVAIHTLKMLMNVKASDEVEVADRFDLQLPIGSEEELLALAMQSNPELDAKRKQTEATGYEIDAAKSEKYPSFNVMLRKDWNDESLAITNGSYTIAGVLAWKITDFGVTDSSVNMAAAKAAQEKAETRSKENMVRIELLTAWNKLQAAEKQVLTNLLSVQQADEARELVQRRYNNGVSTITELLAANTAVDKARAELVSARYDVNVQKAKILLATGQMDAGRI